MQLFANLLQPSDGGSESTDALVEVGGDRWVLCEGTIE